MVAQLLPDEGRKEMQRSDERRIYLPHFLSEVDYCMYYGMPHHRSTMCVPFIRLHTKHTHKCLLNESTEALYPGKHLYNTTKQKRGNLGQDVQHYARTKSLLINNHSSVKNFSFTFRLEDFVFVFPTSKKVSCRTCFCSQSSWKGSSHCIAEHKKETCILYRDTVSGKD